MQTKKIKLRKAKLEDADLLLLWRNDFLTRLASHNQNIIDVNTHIKWFKKKLKDINCDIFIAEYDGVPFGTVRSEFVEGAFVLSWTVSPDYRGRGLSKEMVRLLVEQLNGIILAEIREENVASIRIADSLGMQLDRKKDDVLYYKLFKLDK